MGTTYRATSAAAILHDAVLIVVSQWSKSDVVGDSHNGDVPIRKLHRDSDSDNNGDSDSAGDSDSDKEGKRRRW